MPKDCFSKQRKEIEKLPGQPNAETSELIAQEEPKHTPTSKIPQAFFTNYKGDHFIAGIENKISAVAHGWYDTYLESPDAEIIRDGVNPLQYVVKLYAEGSCVIRLYGVREDGFKKQLAVYTIHAIKQ